MEKQKPKKKPSKKRIKSELDKLWRNKIHERCEGKCEICGKSPVQAHHVFSRRYTGSRWLVDNGVGLCYFHHKFFAHVKYEEFRCWFIERIGQDRFDAIKEMAYNVVKFTPDDLDRIKEELS